MATTSQLEKAFRRGVIRTTQRCNLGCPNCFLKTTNRTQPDLTWPQWLRIVDRLREEKMVLSRSTFTGGEPTLWPFLGRAVAMAKDTGIAQSVRVLTNAVKTGVTMADFGPVDVLDITHYGAINRYNMLRLRREGRRKVRPLYVVHLPPHVPVRPASEVLPATCHCISLFFMGDKVYPCGISGQSDVGGFSIEEDFRARLLETDPHMNPTCKTCLANVKNRGPLSPPLTVECGLWESGIGGIWPLRWRFNLLRSGYRWWLRRRG